VVAWLRPKKSCTYDKKYVYVHGRQEVYAPWPSLALQIWGCGGWNKLREKVHLDTPSWEHYKSTWFHNSQQALVVERWLNRVEEDTSGLTFEEWNPTQDILTFEEWNPTQDADASQPSVTMLINSPELCATGFTHSSFFLLLFSRHTTRAPITSRAVTGGVQ